MKQQTPERMFPRSAMLASILLTSTISASWADSNSDPVLMEESRRIEMIERVTPAVVCVMDTKLRAGGSGVLISPDGFGLTNFHVISGLLKQRTGWGGLGNSERYLMEILGVDITGDVAMFRMFPPEPGFDFPYVDLGDSSDVRVGDTAIAMGNPFNLSEDYTPSVTLGLVTGINRYQWGVKGNLTYTNCIQADTPINPGNSGGPLFDVNGEVIGINGRISINERGRFNVGLGYAISSEQIKRFIPSLRAGLLTRHGTWHARVEPAGDKGMVFVEILKSGPAYRAGLRVGDRLLSLDGVKVTSANQLVSLLGTYPANWPVLAQVQRMEETRGIVVRLDPIEPRMRKPYRTPKITNLRETTRVLKQFQHTVFGDSYSAPPDHWSWTVTRNHLNADDNQGETENYLAVSSLDSDALLVREYADGESGDVIRFNAQSAIGTIKGTTEEYEVDAARSMVLTSLFVLGRDLLGSLEQLHLTDISHIGGDALVPSSLDAQKSIPRKTNGHLDPRILEVIEWPLTEETVAQYAFDLETGRVSRAIIIDSVSDAQITIYFRDHQDIGGLNWPTTIEVAGEGYHYVDTLSNWKLTQ